MDLIQNRSDLDRYIKGVEEGHSGSVDFIGNPVYPSYADAVYHPTLWPEEHEDGTGYWEIIYYDYAAIKKMADELYLLLL